MSDEQAEPDEYTPANDRPKPPLVDQSGALAPDWYSAPELAAVLCGHDISALYRWLNAAGVSQRRIAALTGSTQPQIADILTGRRGQVQAYAVLARIAEGLSIPRERMGLSFWGPDGRWHGPADTYSGGDTVTDTPEGVIAAMLRRHVIAHGGMIIAGALSGLVPSGVPVPGVGDLLGDLGTPPPVALPAQLTWIHVEQTQELTRQLGVTGCAYGSAPQVSSASAAAATELLEVPGAEPVRQALLVAVAELHIHAGWAAVDGGLYTRAMYHFARALELATDAGDTYVQALAFNRAGLVSIEHGHPDDGLKLLQAGQVRAWDIPRALGRSVIVGEGSRAAVEACSLADSATALGALGQTQDAHRHLGRSRELWLPTPTDPAGDLDYVSACLEMDRGRLDAAEQFAAASVRRWESASQRARTRSGIVLATIHVRAGEPRGLQLAHTAITAATKLTSVRARQRLLPLADALDTRPGTDARDLARTARQIAA